MGATTLRVEDEDYSIAYDEVAGVIFEGYDIDSEVMAEALSNTYRHAHVMEVLRAIALETGYEGMEKEINTANLNQAINLMRPLCALEAALLVHNDNPEVRQIVASSILLHPLSALVLSRDSESSVRKDLASNHSIGVSRALAKLIQDKDAVVRTAAFNNEFLNEELQEKVFEYQKMEKMAMAGNKGASEKILRRLYALNDFDFNYQMCTTPNFPLDLQWELVNSKKEEFKEILLEREILDGDLAMHLAQDSSPRVMTKAAQNSPRFDTRVTRYLFDHRPQTHVILATVAKDPRFLEEIALVFNAQVRINVTRNPNAPLKLVRSMQRDEDQLVSSSAKSIIKRRENTFV